MHMPRYVQQFSDVQEVLSLVLEYSQTFRESKSLLSYLKNYVEIWSEIWYKTSVAEILEGCVCPRYITFYYMVVQKQSKYLQMKLTCTSAGNTLCHF